MSYEEITDDSQAALFQTESLHPVPTPPPLSSRKRRRIEDDLIVEAQGILRKRMRRPGAAIVFPDTAKNYLKLLLGEREEQVFVCLFLDVKLRVIVVEEMFRGSLRHTSVYPREVVRRCMTLNASGVIVAHNQPAGDAQPTDADQHLSLAMRNALNLVDTRLVDQFIVTAADVFSFAENGLI